VVLCQKVVISLGHSELAFRVNPSESRQIKVALGFGGVIRRQEFAIIENRKLPNEPKLDDVRSALGWLGFEAGS
jgi:hypothetical protein